MSFTCELERGKVALSPSENQSYRILGKREQRKVTTCSPFEDRCRRVMVHRFDLECGGASTSWRSVAAAMAPWTGADYDAPVPTRRYAGPYPRFYFAPPYGPPMAFGPFGPARRYTIPSAPWQTSLPSGFAPIPERLAHFTTIPDAGSPGPMAESQSIPLPSRKPEPPGASAGLAKSESKPSTASPSASSAVHAVSSATPPGKPSVEVAKSEQQVTPRPDVHGSGEVTGAIPKPSKAPPQSTWINAIGAAGLFFVVLIFFASSFVLSRRHGRSLQLVEGFPCEPMASDTKLRRPHEPAPPNPPFPSHSEWLPSTVSEALDVLGASPETGVDVLKAIVRSLRRTWHPDLAPQEEDRRARERKLKQVNVAWDIVSGKRGARKPSAAA